MHPRRRLGPRRRIPDEETVEVKVRPFLRLPPVVLLAFVYVLFGHSDGGRGLADGVEEDGTPGDVVLPLAKAGRKLEL